MRRTRGLVVAFAAALAAASSLAPGATAAPAQVSGYVVVLEEGAGPPAAVAERLADRYGGEVGFVYSHALRGFSIRTTDRAAAALASNPKVDYVEADGVMNVVAEDPPQTIPTGIRRIFADTNTNLDIDGTDDMRVNVDVAVIDTGIDLEHPDLNVAGQTNCTYESGGPIFSRTASCVDGEGDDDHYHGTHVAGTVAALDNGIGVVGVAPGARLWAVKVLKSNGSGSNSMVIAGIDWVVAKGGIEVANMSLGGSKAQAVNDAVANAVDKGVNMVVAAGNSDADASNYSPASEPEAITVSALADFDGAPGELGSPTCRTDEDDTFANFSNYGTVIDIIAPGVCIESTYPLEQGSYGTISGTSMASPHVAGAVALLRSVIDQTTVSPKVAAESAEDDLLAVKTGDWNNDDDGDLIKEPLLDVSSFAADLDETGAVDDGDSGGDGGGDGGGGTIQFSGTSSTQGARWWKATVTVSGAASGTTITGTWDNNKAGGCTADSAGGCSFSLTKIANSVDEVTWTYDVDTTRFVTIGRPVT